MTSAYTTELNRGLKISTLEKWKRTAIKKTNKAIEEAEKMHFCVNRVPK
jgi:hypothetical protein